MGRKRIEEINVKKHSTPIDPEYLKDLIPDISYHDELDEFEATNIKSAYQWAYNSRKLKKEIISLFGLKLLHKEMFKFAWNWAGLFRSTQKNIGIEAHLIQDEIKKMCDDVNFQIKNKVYSLREISARLHHRLVWIHPFENGNGRHARAVSDLLLYYHKQEALYWGTSSAAMEYRQKYISALKKADRGEYKDLFALVKV